MGSRGVVWWWLSCMIEAVRYTAPHLPFSLPLLFVYGVSVSLSLRRSVCWFWLDLHVRRKRLCCKMAAWCMASFGRRNKKIISKISTNTG